MRLIHIKLSHISLFITSLLSIAAATVPAHAFELSAYADNSVLAEGTWVRISVAESGIHLITNEELKRYGFSDPSKVHVYGYGGARISDVLSRGNYTDDLPAVQSERISRGLVFYATGPTTWTLSGSNYTHSNNPFSTTGYYFLSDRPIDKTPEIPVEGRGGADNPATTFTERLFYENDLVTPGQTGHQLLGEDFRYQPTRTFNFTLTDKASSGKVWMKCMAMVKALTSQALMSFTANGADLPASSTDRIRVAASDAFGNNGTTTKEFDLADNRLALGVSITSSGTMSLANLDYIDINYVRDIKLSGGTLLFRSSSTGLRLSGGDASTRVWDITDPLAIKAMKTSTTQGGVSWTNVYTGRREYAAWNENATFRTPVFVGRVDNQNLHAVRDVDMVIVSLPAWTSQAERVAQLHRDHDAMNVLVVNQQDVFNEFSSGTPDVNAFRRLFKMLWDRGNASGHPLRFALMMGRGSYDNRAITSQVKALNYPMMPIWESDYGTDTSSSYTTDDILTFLKDNSGNNMGADSLCIAIGRMPVRSLSEATTVVDKLYKYVNNAPKSTWKNQVLLLADDMDQGIHMTQMESAYDNMTATPDGSQFFYNKVYLDAYNRSSAGGGSSYPDARQQFYRLMNEGMMWWTYVGHSNEREMTGEGIITSDDIRNNMYFKHLPILYAATCDIMRWDHDNITGSELMYANADGGIIAGCSATRPVYISDNGILTASVARYITKRGDDGRFLPFGEIIRQGKNHLTFNTKDNMVYTNSNKLRYVVMGDPAMRMATPDNRVTVTHINGVEADPDAQITLKGRENAVIEGIVTNAAGELIADFNGTLDAVLYDAEKSTTSKGHGGDSGKEVTFEQQGDRLFAGRGIVTNGKFTLRIAMPTNIAGNFRPAALNLYASSTDNREAMGCDRELYVYGYDETAPADNVSPVIDSAFLNHESYRDGDRVNESPMFIASIHDDLGINLSSAGVGQSMSLSIDDNDRTYNDLSLYYTPADDGSPAGTVHYPISDLSAGNHTMRFRVWDTSGNMAEWTTGFFVEPGATPTIYDIYTDVNPATTEANFYLSHNRPDANITVTVSVYNMLGHLVWSHQQSGRSDMFTTFPVKWDLNDNGGRRVNRGIYIYKAAISTDGEHYDTATKKIAVTGK
ncbi:MAG: type IX secretion system sortase PorU [Pseudoflavonifractor sp.]|nr:type IX secretion system sortase PorU [Pseudoflavonifractor sp.]